MSRSKLLIAAFGLLVFFSMPEQLSYGQIDDGDVISYELKDELNNNEDLDFKSVHSEFVEEDKPYTVVDCELTFYTSLASCNGSNAGITASGETLSETSIAIPRKSMSFGTKIDLDDYGVRYADDVGNPKYIRIKDDGTYIFDVHIPRNNGESDKEYHRRVIKMGRVKTTAKVYFTK